MTKFNLSGIPIYHVNKIYSETQPDGSVLVVCGVMHGGEFFPEYATFSPAETALTDGPGYLEAARSRAGAH